MERGTVERLAGRKGASRVALNGLSPLEQPDASRTDVSSGVIQFMKPWTHACTTHIYVCMYARLLFCRYTARMDRKRPGLNAPGIGLRAFCIVATQLRDAVDFVMVSPMLRAHDLFLRPRYADILVVKSRRLSRRI